MVVNMHEAKSNLSRLVTRVVAGEDVIIARNGVPVARLVPYGSRTERRTPGAWEGRVRIADDFDELPADLLALFEGEGE